MKNRKINLIVLLLFISVLFLSYKYYEKYSFYKDTEMLNLKYDKFTFKERIGGIEDDEYKLMYDEFNGVNTIWDIIFKEDSMLKITVDSKVSKGKLKVVLLTSDSEIINVLNQNDSGSKLFDLKHGVNKLRIVGEKATGEIYIKVESEDYMQLIPYYAITR